jgi:hypothetical protein
LVVILWGCLVSERLTVRKASLEMDQALQEMGQQQIKVRHTTPAWPRRVRPAESYLLPAFPHAAVTIHDFRLIQRLGNLG